MIILPLGAPTERLLHLTYTQDVCPFWSYAAPYYCTKYVCPFWSSVAPGCVMDMALGWNENVFAPHPHPNLFLE